MNYSLREVFYKLDYLKISQVAKKVGVSHSLISQYLMGVKKPRPERVKAIETAIRQIGEELLAVSITGVESH